ncbi:MAG: hypothetical protein HYV96_16680 [Opitutae bacterium]|nr:hypothetical protein [Opitutae bacterium]
MPLSISTLKSIRKWRDRAFMAGQVALDRVRLPRGRRVLVTPWPEVEAALRRSFHGTGHAVAMAEMPAGGGDFDVVVPLTIAALEVAARDDALRRRNPLPLPSLAAIRRCDDKAELIAHLRARGFAAHLPGDAAPGRWPYMLKRRWDACARNAFCVAGAADEAALAAQLASADFLRQEWIGGEMEYTAHLLHFGGSTRRALTLSFRMPNGRSIRGRDPVALHRRCRSRHVALFEAMLNAAEFEGLCCVNYKERDGVPIVLEINPRFGFSLAPFFAAFVRSFRW